MVDSAMQTEMWIRIRFAVTGSSFLYEHKACRLQLIITTDSLLRGKETVFIKPLRKSDVLSWLDRLIVQLRKAWCGTRPSQISFA